MKTLSTAVVALALGLGSTAHAATIAFDTFTSQAWQNAANGGVYEDFEDQSTDNFSFAGAPRNAGGNLYGELAPGGYTSSTVGTFSTLGGMGMGTTCSNLLDTGSAGCNEIALQYGPGINGQGNALPDTGFWSLNSADTLGMSWDASLDNGGEFQKIAFALTDPGDNNADVLSISIGSDVWTWSDLDDGETWLAVITLDQAVTSATINIETSLRDGFTLDGAALAPVPLPAPILMLLAALGALFVMRRRQSAPVA